MIFVRSFFPRFFPRIFTSIPPPIFSIFFVGLVLYARRRSIYEVRTFVLLIVVICFLLLLFACCTACRITSRGGYTTATRWGGTTAIRPGVFFFDPLGFSFFVIVYFIFVSLLLLCLPICFLSFCLFMYFLLFSLFDFSFIFRLV